MRPRVESPVIVITGSSDGLGLATAHALLSKGARVMLSSENRNQLRACSARLQTRFGERVSHRLCDVRDGAQVQALLDATLQQFGTVHGWINNAGTTAPSGPARQVPVGAGRTLLDVNVMGTYHGSIAALRQFRRQGHGRLINVVGRGEKRPVAGAALYGSSKAWIRQFTLALAKEEPDLAIGTFNPGLLYTGLTARPRILAGHEAPFLKGLRMVMPLIGDTPERAAAILADLVSGRRRIKRRNVSRSLLPFLLGRLLTGRRAPVDIDAITPQLTPPEDGPIA